MGFPKKLAEGLRAGQRGFTLIELLIVVAILGILAAVIIPNVAGFMVTGRLNAANTEEENVKTAALAYYAENTAYPASSTSLAGTFLAGTPKATYSFDTTYGWITSATTTGWTLSFSAGSAGTAGYHGKWVR